ncbi:hypothetical protein [Micromonospora okii]|uniref:hypothetical protein n=1 Tax=Micromonospora okii TaxID=1182970 RepID=UPI001E360744|nr:hypothetical protein [Micromonospora okii]
MTVTITRNGIEITSGTLVLTGRALGRVTRVGTHAGAPGAWVVSSTGDPGSAGGYPTFCPDVCLKPAVVGMTVCATPRGHCYCGRAHLSAGELGRLSTEEVPA